MEQYLPKWENQWLMIIIPSSSQLTQEDRKSHSFSQEKRDFSYAPLLRRFDHRLGVAMPAAPGSFFDVYGTLGHHYYYYY